MDIESRFQRLSDVFGWGLRVPALGGPLTRDSPMNGGHRGKKIRVLLADRVGVFRFGLEKLLAVEDDLRVVAQTHSASELLVLAKSFQPDLLFIQAEIIQGTCGRLLSDLRRLSQHFKVVVMSSSPPGAEEGLRYVRMGAAGVILKSVEASLFVECARQVIWEGRLWLPHHQVARPTNPWRPILPCRCGPRTP